MTSLMPLLRAACSSHARTGALYDGLAARSRRRASSWTARMRSVRSSPLVLTTSRVPPSRAADRAMQILASLTTTPAERWNEAQRRGRDLEQDRIGVGHHVGRAGGRLVLDHAGDRRLMKDHVKRPDFQVRFTWSPNAVVLWDNRCTLHRGRRYDDVEILGKLVTRGPGATQAAVGIHTAKQDSTPLLLLAGGIAGMLAVFGAALSDAGTRRHRAAAPRRAGPIAVPVRALQRPPAPGRHDRAWPCGGNGSQQPGCGPRPGRCR